MKSRIYYTKPSITDREIDYAADAVANGWGENCYDYIYRFEEEFQRFLGVKHAISTASCTGALHMGLAGLGVGEGDEVILADINWIASAAPVIYLGATPVLVDVDPVSWCVDPKCVERAITGRTKAIIAVHLYGNLCDLDSLRDIASRHGLALIEDSAEAVGSKWHGHSAGAIGDFGAFSFHGTKTLTTGEGGMFVTNSDELHTKVLTLSNHGRAAGQSRQFWPDRVGFKYKMSNVQAAIGLAQIERAGELIARKREIFKDYSEALEGLPIQLNPQPEGTQNGYWMPTVVFAPEANVDRDKLLGRFREENIDGRVFFWPLSDTGHFEVRHATPVAHRLYLRAINLPSYHDITETEIARVADCVRACF